MAPRLKQKNLARIRLETYKDPKINKTKLVAMGGYGKSVQQTPSKVLESKGYKEALAEFGLTEELITSSLISDIKDKPKNRLGELRLGAEILGMNDKENQKQPLSFNQTIININTPK